MKIELLLFGLLFLGLVIALTVVWYFARGITQEEKDFALYARSVAKRRGIKKQDLSLFFEEEMDNIMAIYSQTKGALVISNIEAVIRFVRHSY